MEVSRDMLVIGGVYIADNGTKNLLEYFDGSDTGQDLSSQTFQDTPTLYITMHPAIKAFVLVGYRVGYVDGSANADDLANIHFYEGAEADDYLNQMKCVYSTGAIAETPLTAVGTYTELDTPIPVYLDTRGRLYFKTTWSNACIECGTGEHFFLIVYGKQLESA